jgi:hypothetical protein
LSCGRPTGGGRSTVGWLGCWMIGKSGWMDDQQEIRMDGWMIGQKATLFPLPTQKSKKKKKKSKRRGGKHLLID